MWSTKVIFHFSNQLQKCSAGNSHALVSNKSDSKTPQRTNKAHISTTRICSLINIAHVPGIRTCQLTSQYYERYKCVPYSILVHSQFHFCYHMKLLHCWPWKNKWLLLSSTQNGHVARATAYKNKILNSATVPPYFIHNTRLIANTSQTPRIYRMIGFGRITSKTQFFFMF